MIFIPGFSFRLENDPEYQEFTNWLEQEYPGDHSIEKNPIENNSIENNSIEKDSIEVWLSYQVFFLWLQKDPEYQVFTNWLEQEYLGDHLFEKLFWKELTCSDFQPV